MKSIRRAMKRQRVRILRERQQILCSVLLLVSVLLLNHVERTTAVTIQERKRQSGDQEESRGSDGQDRDVLDLDRVGVVRHDEASLDDNGIRSVHGSSASQSGGSSGKKSKAAISGTTDLDILQELVEHRNADQNQTQQDELEDGIFDPLAADPSCRDSGNEQECWEPPISTIEEEQLTIDATCLKGGDDPSEEEQQECTETPSSKQNLFVDKHWGSDTSILQMRDQLRIAGSGETKQNTRPPIFLMPGLASTRLVAWRHKTCPHHPLLSDIKVQDYVWLNINLVIQMGTFHVDCMKECMRLGVNQTDTDDLSIGCKLRPDEGLDAISSLAPGGIGSQLLVGGTNTVYAWLIQWLADNLGYDVGNIIGLPYDWRLSPERMESRDGFLTLTRRRIEAAVKSNGEPGIMVAHSMGNTIFRYFLVWLRQEMRDEAYQKYVKQAQKRSKARSMAQSQQHVERPEEERGSTYFSGWILSGAFSSFDEWWNAYFAANKGEEQNEEVTKEKFAQLWELAQIEGDENYFEWLETHIWTYVGLSAPLLGAVNPLRAVISGENMGLPVTDEAARVMELTFGSTHTVNPISSKLAFCDQWEVDEWGEEPSQEANRARRDLFCLDDLMNEIENSQPGRDPWEQFPVLRTLLKDRADWDTAFPMIKIIKEMCEVGEKGPCASNTTTKIGPRDAQSGELFKKFNSIWKEEEEPLKIKLEQLRESFWDTNVPNILAQTWDRPHIKHVIMAYGVDVPTEVGYVYRKREIVGEGAKIKKSVGYDGIPNLEQVIWEETHGDLTVERLDIIRGKSITDSIVKRKVRREPLAAVSRLQHSGDGTIPYLSLSWAHTWLLHGVRARRHSEGEQPGANALDHIEVSHRPTGDLEWVQGPPPNRTIIDDKKKNQEDSDTGTSHPHGTKYKPEMVRFHNVGRSRKTGMEYSTTVIEAIGVEHKETTRNYDILAAVFTDVLRHMHADFGLV